MASLTGQTISSTYDSLLKVTDNGPLNSSLKTITDGLGNSSSLQLSTVAAYITGGLTVTGQLTLPGAFDLTVNGFTIGKGPGALNNTVYGFQSLLSNTTGVFNTANGYQSLYNNTIGEYNTSFGLQSMFSNVAGGNNVGIGANSLPSNTSGNNNTAIGRYAGFGTGTNNNITGSNNIFIGYQSVGISSSESNRTWIGNSSTLATWVGGNLLVGGTANNGFGLEVTGTSKISGQLTLGSTITNGTYTYTLPSATGTIALVGGAGVGTVTSVAAITLGTSGTDLSSTVANGTTTPVITLNVPDASATARGVVTTGTQTFAGDKTLTGSLYGIGLSMTGTSGDIIGSVATTGKALRGTATTGFGVYASSTTGQAIYAESTGTGGSAVNGTAANGIGGYFFNNSTGFSTLIVSNFGSGNLAQFSNSAGTKFTINNAGNLGNGTYTYTLPSATGTLALTSALSGYLPLTGGTLTGALSGTSVTLSGNVIFDTTDRGIVSNTTDGADNKFVSINGGGARGSDRGAGINLFGNEAAGTGRIDVNAGDVTGGVINLVTAGLNRLTVARDGNVGIGVTPSAWFTSGGYKVLQIGAGLSLDSGNDFRARLASNAYVNTSGDWAYSNTGFASNYIQTSGTHVWSTAPSGAAGNAITFTERMIITSGGGVLIGKTAEDSNTRGVFFREASWSAFSNNGDTVVIMNRNTSTGTVLEFKYANTVVGSVSVTGSATSYNTSSDYRLKEDLQEIKGLERVQAIKVYDYKWKSFDSRMDGVLAHELAEILPYAVNGVKDEVDEDGNDKMQGVDYSKLVPIMIKAIQEQQAQIEELKLLIK